MVGRHNIMVQRQLSVIQQETESSNVMWSTMQSTSTGHEIMELKKMKNHPQVISCTLH